MPTVAAKAPADDDTGDDVTASAADLRERDEEKKRSVKAAAFADKPTDNGAVVDVARREASIC